MFKNSMFYVLIFYLLITFSSSRFTSHNKNEIDIISEYGKFLLANMDQSIDPCEDFYQYACGNYKNNKLIPIDGRNKSSMQVMQLKMDKLIKNFLNDSTSNLNRTSEIKMKNFYLSCIAVDSTFGKGYKEVLNIIKETEPNDWIDINFLSEIGIHPLLPINVSFNFNTLTYEIYINSPYAVLSNFDFENFTIHTEVEAGQPYDNMKEEFQKVKQFEQILTFSNKQTLLTEILPLNEFIDAHKDDNIDWERFFDVAFNGSALDTWIVNYNVKSIDRLGTLLENTDMDTLLLYVKWRTMVKFYNIWHLLSEEESTEDACMGLTLVYFTKVIIPWFINATFDVERRADILQLSQSIRNSFNYFIDQCEWMDELTKSGAKTKLNAIDISIGFTDEMKHYTNNDMLFENISISENFWKNFINLRIDSYSRKKAKMGLSDNPSELKSTWIVNAAYDLSINELFVNTAISQLPMYHRKFPASLKYGGIGFIIGHEIAHAFDFDTHNMEYLAEEGNWWSNKSLLHLKERYKCLEAQYYKFIFDGFRNDGNYTLSENMADNIGTRLAYHAYVTELGNSSAEVDSKPLLNIDYTNKQLFFLKFAQTWCTGYDDKTIRSIMKNDVHSYEKFRVQGTLMNIPEFSEAFQCQLGTTMNPFRKCIIW